MYLSESGKPRANEWVRQEDVAINALFFKDRPQHIRFARRRSLELVDPSLDNLRIDGTDLCRLGVGPPACRVASTHAENLRTVPSGDGMASVASVMTECAPPHTTHDTRSFSRFAQRGARDAP